MYNWMTNGKNSPGLAPSYIFSLIVPYTPSRPSGSLGGGYLIVPQFNKNTFVGRAFAHQGALPWNNR